MADNEKDEYEVTFTLAPGYDEADAVDLYDRIETHPAVSGAALVRVHGREELCRAILAVAAAICQAQIKAHEAGESLHYITELLPFDVATNKLGKEAA